MIDPITITKNESDFVYKLNAEYLQIGKIMTFHTGVAETKYLKRTQSDVFERRRQAKLDYAKEKAAEEERQRQREEEDAIHQAKMASLQEAAGIQTKKRRRE